METTNQVSPEKREFRNFGLLLGCVSALIGGFLWWKGRPSFPYFFLVAGLFFVLGLLWPVALKPAYRVWMAVGRALGLVMTKVILILLFYLIMTPIGLVCRLFGKDFLNMRIEKSKDSYWIKKSPSKPDKKSYEYQY